MNGSSPTLVPRGPQPPTAAPVAAAPKPAPAALPILLALGLLVLPSACVERGDFGRPKAGVWNDAILPATGSIAARSRGEPVSGFAFTDAEDELRDRAWRFLMPAKERSAFDTLLADLVRTRVRPASDRPFDPSGYHDALLGEPFVSPASRFRRIGEDAEADARLIGPFAGVARHVLDADRLRLRSLPFVAQVTGSEVADATARAAENRCLIAWVRHAAGERVASYRYAVEHGFIEMPQVQALDAERAIGSLSVQRRILDALPVGAWRDGACLAPAIAPPRPLRAPLVVKS